MTTQVMRAVTQVPPIAFQDYPVDIHLRIYREGARYEADILAVGQVQPVTIEISPEELLALNIELREEMQAVASQNADGIKLSAAEFKAQLHSLAKAGHYAFKQVFGEYDDPAALAIQSALRFAREQLGNSRAVSIQITSEDFALPWELIYSARLGDVADSYEHFWGMNCVISRAIVRENRREAFVSPLIPVAHCPKVGLMTYKELPAVVQKEIPFFEGLEKVGKIVLFKLRALAPDPDKEEDEFKAFKFFWENAFNLAHFACHAFYEDELPHRSYILLTDGFPIKLMDMKTYGIDMSSRPLIIMNACNTGNLNPLYTSHFARAFLDHGARGVVATECAVPDAFAADFAQQLYDHLLAGEPLGESLLATRRYFLEKYHSPSGLLYSMYAPPSIRLARMEK